MNFSDIFNKYVTDNKLSISLESSSILQESTDPIFILEAKKAKAELYKDLTISATNDAVTAQDVANIKFYEKGKSTKEGKSEEQLNKINGTQADLFNKIFAKVKADSKSNKTTLVELTAAAVKIFRDAGQNAPTAGYNLRGVLSVLINQKKMLSPAGGSIDASAVTVTNADMSAETEDIESSVDTDEEEIRTSSSPDSVTGSKFDSAVQDNKPTSSSSNSYFEVEKGVSIEKTDFESREARIAARYLIDTIREELPGTYNKESLIAKTQEEDAGMTPEEVTSMISHLVRKGKIKLVPQSTGEGVPDAQDDEDVAPDREFDRSASDVVDRLSLGATRKGFTGNSDIFRAFDEF